MNQTLKKVIKYGFVTLLLSTAIVAIAVSLLLNIVFTPEKITPIVLRAVNQELNAEVNAQSIGLTFFSTFPKLSLEVKKGSHVKHIHVLQTHSQISPPSDTLLTFEKGFIAFNPVSFLKEDKIDIKQILLVKPTVNAVIGADGEANWNILKEASEENTSVEPVDTNHFQINLTIADIRMQEGTLFYQVQVAKTQTGIQDLDVTIMASANSDIIHFKTNLEAGKVGIWQDNKLMGDDFAFGISTDLTLDKKNRVLTVGKTTAQVNDMKFTMQGKLLPTRERKLVIDLDLTFQVPTLAAILDLVPEHIFQHGKGFQTKGIVALWAKLQGNYGSGDLPALSAGLTVKEGIKNITI